MIECGQNSKPKKLPGPKINPQKSHAQFPSHNKFGRTLFAKLGDPQKKSRNRKFQTQNSSSIIPFTWNPGVTLMGIVSPASVLCHSEPPFYGPAYIYGSNRMGWYRLFLFWWEVTFRSLETLQKHMLFYFSCCWFTCSFRLNVAGTTRKSRKK